MNQQERIDYIDKGWTGEGWLPIIKELNEKLSVLDPTYSILQIKEKFGGLRYYFGISKSNENHQEDAQALASQYEALSYSICEYCGSKENVSTEGRPHWVLTLCASCAEKSNDDKR